MQSESLPRAIPQEVLESCPDACFTCDESLNIQYCNPAWNCFALANQGGPEVLGDQVISRNLLDFVSDSLKEHYAGLFARARALGKPVNHDYECSSATLFRLYRMQVFPLDSGFAVINSLRVEHPHDRTPIAPDDAVYRNASGFVRMCSNCRRTNRAADPSAWDWVPAYVDRGEGVTHGICQPCLEFYYRPYLPTPSKA